MIMTTTDRYKVESTLQSVESALRLLPVDVFGYAKNAERNWPIRDELIANIQLSSMILSEMFINKEADEQKKMHL